MTVELMNIETARDLVQQTALLLDDEKFSDWVELFDVDGTYELLAYSTEIRRWMTWQHSDRDTLQKMLEQVHEHVRDPARRRHVVSMPRVQIAGAQAKVTSQFSLFRTLPDGETSLYMVGGYEDRIVKRDDRWFYSTHKVVVDTRMLDMFTHIPV